MNRRNAYLSIMLGVAGGAAYLLMALTIQKWTLIAGVLISSDFTLREALIIWLTVAKSWHITSSGLERGLIVTGSGLAGLQMGLISYLLLTRRKFTQAGKAGTGMVLAGFASGCASCGSLLLGTVLGLTGSGVVLAYLPLAGLEFGILGLGILVWSTYMTWRKVRTPIAC